MGLAVTIALTLGGLAVVAFFGWMGARPVKLMGPPRLVPWRILMLFPVAFMVLVLTHLVALLRGS